MLKRSSIRRTAAALTAAAALLVATPAFAGPPLICHQFEAGRTATLLPWLSGTGDWRAPDPSYDLSRLTSDTLRLLSPETPILARMETLRRATIYAVGDARVAADLLRAVTDRAKADAGQAQDPLAWFDAGYLIESFRQVPASLKQNLPRGIAEVSGLDGYGMVVKAIRLAGTPEMEYAASLMRTGPEAAAHRQRAQAGAAPGSLLARNLAEF